MKIRHTLINIIEKASGQKHFLFAVHEVLEPDMQDYADNIPSKDVEVEGYKLSLIHSFKDSIPKTEQEEGNSIVCTMNQETPLTKVLPWREGPFYVLYNDLNTEDATSLINRHPEIKSAVAKLTLCELGFDLTKFEQSWGVEYLVRHHSVLKNIYFRLSATKDNFGIMCHVCYRIKKNIRLRFVLYDVDNDGNKLQEGCCEIQNGEDLFFIRFGRDINALSVYVFDINDQLIFKEERMHFIRRIEIRSSITNSQTGEIESIPVHVIGIKKSNNADISHKNHNKEIVTKIEQILNPLSLNQRNEILIELAKKYETH